MDKKINFQQLVELFSQSSGMSRNWSEQFVKSFFDIISEKVVEEGLVKIKGLGTFKLVETENRESVNVNTGERIVIEGHRKVNFIPESELKEFINSPFAAFDTVQLDDGQVEELARIESESVIENESVIESESVVENESPVEEADAEVALADSADEPEPESTVGTESVADSTDIQTAVNSQDRETRRFSPLISVFLKVLAWVLSIFVILCVIIYAVWPMVAVALFRDMETERKFSQASAIKQRLENEQLMYLYGDTMQDSIIAGSEPVITEQPVSNTEPNLEALEKLSSEESAMEKPAQNNDRPASAGLVLLEVDEMRSLTEYTKADTVNYRIAGELAEHIVLPGETLSKLALQYYGTKKLWPFIAKYNEHLENSDHISTGDVVRIPLVVNR